MEPNSGGAWPIWLRKTAPDTWLMTLHVQPGAKQSAWAGLYGDALKIKLAALPVEGKANAALQAFIAERLGLPKAAITLTAGPHSRRKTLLLSGLSEARMTELLHEEWSEI